MNFLILESEAKRLSVIKPADNNMHEIRLAVAASVPCIHRYVIMKQKNYDNKRNSI